MIPRRILFSANRQVSSFKSRKTGRICGNCVLPRQEWRFDKAMGRGFQRQMGRRFGFDMGIEDRLLLASLGQRQRRLDDKKRKQLADILGHRLDEATSANEAIAERAIQFTQVKVNTSFTEVAVYWMCDGKTDEETTEILEKERHSLRRALSDSIGSNCPEIKFYPDRSNLLVQEMDRLFKVADYGVDYRTLSNTARVMGAVKKEEKEDQKPQRPEKIKPPPEWKRRLLEKKRAEEECT